MNEGYRLRDLVKSSPHVKAAVAEATKVIAAKQQKEKKAS